MGQLRKKVAPIWKLIKSEILATYSNLGESATGMLNTGSILEYQKGLVSNVLAFQPCHVCCTLIRSKIVFVAAQSLSRPSMANFEDFLGFLMNSAENRIWQIKNFIIARCPSSHWSYMASVSAIQKSK